MNKSIPSDSVLSLQDAHLRPSERVTQYLLKELERPERAAGGRLPSNRELARLLKVSVPTVQGVLRKLGRAGRVRSSRGSGTYLVPLPTSAKGSLKIEVAALLQTQGMQDLWLREIFAGLMSAVLKSPKPVLLSGIAPEEYGTDISARHLLDERANAHGLIIIPFALRPDHRREVVEAYERDGKPVVHCWPTAINATANFVSTDYLDIASRLGDAWQQTGRRHILLLGEDIQKSMSSRLRHMGLIAGLGSAVGGSVSLRLDRLPQDKGEVHQLLASTFEKRHRPDAVFSSSPHVAMNIVSGLQKLGLRVPEDVSVATDSISSNHEALRFGLTGTQQPLHEIGRLLLEMLCERIEKNGASLPGRFLSAAFTGGATTRPEENAILGI